MKFILPDDYQSKIAGASAQLKETVKNNEGILTIILVVIITIIFGRIYGKHD